jgi:hypothetical protein
LHTHRVAGTNAQCANHYFSRPETLIHHWIFGINKYKINLSAKLQSVTFGVAEAKICLSKKVHIFTAFVKKLK